MPPKSRQLPQAPQQAPPQVPIQAPMAQGPPINNPLMALLTQGGNQPPPMGVGAYNGPGPGAAMSNQMQQIGSYAPTPPVNPVVDIYDNTPPIVREAIRRRLFTQGM